MSIKKNRSSRSLAKKLPEHQRHLKTEIRKIREGGFQNQHQPFEEGAPTKGKGEHHLDHQKGLSLVKKRDQPISKGWKNLNMAPSGKHPEGTITPMKYPKAGPFPGMSSRRPFGNLEKFY